MNFNQFSISKKRIEILLGLSLTPLLIKSINYIFIGSPTPLFAFMLFGGLLLFAYSNETKYRSLIVKIWSGAIIFWGIARISIMTLFLTTSVDEAHVRSQFGIWFILLSTVYIAAGLYLFTSAKKADSLRLN